MNALNARTSMITLAVACLVVACGGGDGKGRRDSPEIAKAREFFSQTCATCHGEDGRADNDVARALDPTPRDFSSFDWQRSRTDDEIRAAILDGGHAVGKSRTMPPHAQLRKEPSGETLTGLVQLVRSFQHR